MSSQNNWNNPDMYYQQERPQSGPSYDSNYGSNVSNVPASYNSGSAYGAGAAYGAQPNYAGSAAGYPMLPPNNTLAIIGMVASIFGFVSSIFIAGIAGIIMGHIALKQIRERGERGEGMAKAALWVGYIGTALWVLFWIVYVLFFVVILGGVFFAAGVS
ncbi:DUF4190 domain-containing protein [Brevibacterium sp.]|uniref:DUF4190 domain-containing protein n=1 Tax=Brevibacterium sp. TaxID=1701 RepID=UPI002810F31D|nr:DUF4190 domain-containing protein [Brevibacterium sp.]